MCVCVCVCAYAHKYHLFFQRTTRGKDGRRGTVWSETNGKSCRQFFGSSSLSSVSLPCSPLGNNRKPTACIHLRKWQWHRREMLSCSALFLDSGKPCKWWVVCLNIHILCHRIQQIRISFLFVVLKYSQFTILCSLQVYSIVILHYRLLQDNGYNFLCSTLYPYCLPFLYIVVYIY